MARQNTNKLLDMLRNGIINDETVVNMCLGYMSEDDVSDMMRVNDLLDDDESDDED